MRHKNIKYCRRRHRHFIDVLLLSIIWTILFTEIVARPNLDTHLSNKPTNDVVVRQQQKDIVLNEIMTNTNGEKFLNKLRKNYHNQPYFLNKWPGLRDLVLTLDYDDNNGLAENNEFSSINFFERLRQLASSKSESYDDDIRYTNDDKILMPSRSSKQLSFKDHNIKKNVQYMSPCHFKICNMGRKRDANFY